MSTKRINPTQRQNEQFTDNCRYLKLQHLSGQYQQMIDKAHEETMGYFDFINEVVRAEAAATKQRRVKNLIKNSHLPHPLKMIPGFDFDFQPNLDRRLVMDLATMEFMERNSSVLFIGTNGTGKSHLAQSLALLACQKEYRTYYTTLSSLISDLNTGVYEKTLEKRLRKYINPELLVIDEMGHDRLELKISKEAHLLFKVINKRYNDDKPMIFTSNVGKELWPEFLGDPITTSAILDRIFHHSVIVKMEGPSYREYQGKLLQEQYGKNKKEKPDNTKAG
jgi:DNA replication protein DnaC